jgi:hypothetical protein
MSDGFSSYTTSVTSEGPGEELAGNLAEVGAPPAAMAGVSPGANAAAMDKASDELVDLLLSSDGNYVQELLLEEAAKLVDASVRDSIAQVGTSAPLNALADVLRAPKQFADSTIGRVPLPGFLKNAVDAALTPATVLDEVSRVIPSLTKRAETDEQSLQNFNALWEKLNPNATSEESPVALESVQPALPALETVQTNVGPVLEQLGDPESPLRRRLPLFGTLSRRFGSTLLRRVAKRLEEDANRPEIPRLARDLAASAVEVDRNLAAFIEPEVPTESESVESKDMSKV